MAFTSFKLDITELQNIPAAELADCAICQQPIGTPDPYVETEQVLLTPCRHVFGQICPLLIRPIYNNDAIGPVGIYTPVRSVGLLVCWQIR
jgi:hypothetical protein